MGYLLWNNQITRIWGEHEWRSYAGRRKVPRVSYGADAPGVQNTRVLQLPYVLSALLMAVSTTMHWVVSQTLFVVEVENKSGRPPLDSGHRPPELTFAICYSPTAIFVIGVLSIILIIGLTIYYFLPFRSFMPFMAGSARVVFANCTALPKDLPRDGIMWGDVSDEWGRLAGFAENAKGIQKDEIYPERYKRPPVAPPTADIGTDRPTTGRTVATERPQTSRTVGFDPVYEPPELSSRRWPDNRYGGKPDLEPLTIPRNTPKKYARPPTAKSSGGPRTGSRDSTEYPFPDISGPSPTSTRASNSPRTRRPRQASLEFGSGYGGGETRSKSRFGLHPTKEEIVQSSQPYPPKLPRMGEEDSDGDPEWKGWGVNHDKPDSDSESEAVPQPEWRGWGVNPGHDPRTEENDKAPLVEPEWKGWGV
jgi:hypothetical protein